MSPDSFAVHSTAAGVLVPNNPALELGFLQVFGLVFLQCHGYPLPDAHRDAQRQDAAQRDVCRLVVAQLVVAQLVVRRLDAAQTD